MKFNKMIIFALLGFFTINLFTGNIASANSTITIEWTKTFGGGGYDHGSDILQTPDEGYIIVGGTATYGKDGNYDVWLLKTNSTGTIQWNKTYGGYGNDWGTSIQQTADGGYILVGIKNNDAWVIKTDATGNMSWNTTYHLTMNNIANSVQQTTDGGYIVTGTSGNTAFILRLTSNGSIQWSKVFWEAVGQELNSVIQTSDGDFVAVGAKTLSVTGNSSDVWILKINESKDIEWEKLFGGTGYDKGTSVIQTADGGLILTGENEIKEFANTDLLLYKTNANGAKEWSKDLGGSVFESGNCIQQTNDGGFIVLGKTYMGNGTGEKVWLLKTDINGDIEWDRIFSDRNEIDTGSSVRQTSDHGYIIVGKVYTGDPSGNLLLMKLSSGIQTNSNPKTPGFEFIIVVTALAFILFWKRKNIR